jgi:hypothetical protein
VKKKNKKQKKVVKTMSETEAKKEIKVGAIARTLVKKNGVPENWLVRIEGVFGNVCKLRDCGGDWKADELKILYDVPIASVGDIVFTGCPVTPREVIEVITTYRVKDCATGSVSGTSFAVPLNENERTAYIRKRCEELRKKASDAMQEMIALTAQLSVSDSK